MAIVNEDECIAAGLDANEVQKLIRRLDRVAKDAQKMGLTIFGGAGTGSLRFPDLDGNLIVASTSHGSWDGGDGGEKFDENNLCRGE